MRFPTIVQAAGAPRPHPLWLPPERDPDLQRAIREERVLTVHQDVRGTRRDHGSVGFHPAAEAQFLIFPASLKRYRDQRVVAIDYALLAPEEVGAPSPPAPAAVRNKSSSRGRLSAAQPEPKTTAPPAPPAVAARPPAPAASTPTPPPPAKPASRGARHRRSPPEPRAAPATAAVPPTARATAGTPGWSAADLRTLKKTLQELKAGKAVAAYERLQTLVTALEARLQ